MMFQTTWKSQIAETEQHRYAEYVTHHIALANNKSPSYEYKY